MSITASDEVLLINSPYVIDNDRYQVPTMYEVWYCFYYAARYNVLWLRVHYFSTKHCHIDITEPTIPRAYNR